MSGIGDYIYFLNRSYEEGSLPPLNGGVFVNAIKQREAMRAFQEKQIEINNMIRINRAATINKKNENEVTKLLNMSHGVMQGKIDVNKIQNQTEKDIMIRFKAIFEQEMIANGFGMIAENKGGYFSPYHGLNKSDYLSYFDKKLPHVYELTAEEQKTADQWAATVEKLIQLIDSTDKDALKYLKLATGQNDEYMEHFKTNLNSIQKLLKDLGNQITSIDDFKYLDPTTGTSALTAEKKKILKWIQDFNNNTTQGFGMNKDNDTFLNSVRYVSHLLYNPSNIAIAKVTEIADGSLMAAIIGKTAEEVKKESDKIFTGTKTSKLYVKKEDLTPELSKKVFTDKKKETIPIKFNGKEMAVVSIGATQDKADITIKSEIPEFKKYNGGISTKWSETADHISLLTKGNLYTLIANDNNNNFITHYLNVFAPKVNHLYSDNNYKPKIATWPNAPAEVAKQGSESMVSLLTYRAATGEGVFKGNDINKNRSAQYLHAFIGGKWYVASLYDVLYRAMNNDNANIQLSLTGTNRSYSKNYRANIFNKNILPYSLEKTVQGHDMVGVIRRRINATVNYVHNTKVSLGIKNLPVLMGWKKT